MTASTGRPQLIPAGSDDRATAAAFAGRMARWDPTTPVRLVAGPDGRLDLWGTTPFDVLATRAVSGRVTPPDVVVRAADLLAGLAVARAAVVDPGHDVREEWHDELPPVTAWTDVERVPAAELAELARRGADSARMSPTGGASATLLDSEALSATGSGQTVSIPMRLVFALSGMGFAGTGAACDAEDEAVRIRIIPGWLRLDARYGAVVRRRITRLPLLV